MADDPKKSSSKKPKKKEKQKAKPIEMVPSLQSDSGRVYSNFISVSHSPWDFTLRFCDAPPGGDVERLAEKGKLVAPTKAEVIIPVNVMPELINVLKDQLEKYEKIYGEATGEGADEKPSGSRKSKKHSTVH